MRRLVLMGLVLLLVLGALPVSARRTDPLQAHRQRLEELQQRMQETRHRVQVLKKQENRAVDELSTLQQRLERTSVQLEDSQYRLDRAKHQLSITQMALGEAKHQFRREQGFATLRLRAIYKHRQVDYWEALLTAPDLVHFMTRYEYFKHITRSDLDLLTRLDGRMREIGRQQRRYGAALQTISTITENISQQKEEIQEDTQDQSQLVEKIRSERAAAESALAQLERDSQQIEAMIRRLMAARRRMPRMGTGRFMRPVSGPIGDTFGMRYHPILHVMRPHRGLDFPVSSGTPIHAADRGVVIFSGWFGSFGKVVILDHGGDVTTLYAHARSVSVDRGQTVERGARIATVGTTGLSTGPHLHFEVRKNGTPVDPLGYLR